MSKERELLKEIMSYFAKGDITIRKFENSSDVAETLHTAQEILTQPEPFMFKDRKLTGSLIAHDEMYKRGYARAEFDLKRDNQMSKLVEENSKLREDLREGLREEISLRDHFAGLAMQGVLVKEGIYWDYEKLALTSYEMADAMLAERSKK